ncbi:MAG: transcriptional regulator, partial [Colwellia sp.]
IVTSNPILELLHWDEIENQALVFAQFNGIKKLAKVDLGTGETVKLTDRQINWAAQLKNGGIVFTDQMDKFWISNGIEYQLIDTLNEQGGDNKRFLLKGNVLYGINNEYELWRYHLDSNSFETIRSLTADIDNISDIQNENLLVTKRQVANKEVVELVLSQ